MLIENLNKTFDQETINLTGKISIEKPLLTRNNYKMAFGHLYDTSGKIIKTRLNGGSMTDKKVSDKKYDPEAKWSDPMSDKKDMDLLLKAIKKGELKIDYVFS